MLKGPKRQVNSREAARSLLGLVIKPIAVPSHDEWIRKTISGFSPHSSSLSSRLGGFAPLRKKANRQNYVLLIGPFVADCDLLVSRTG